MTAPVVVNEFKNKNQKSYKDKKIMMSLYLKAWYIFFKSYTPPTNKQKTIYFRSYSMKHTHTYLYIYIYIYIYI